MSAQLGRWNFDDSPVNRDHFENVSRTIAAYGPDGGGFYSRGSVSIRYCAFHTTTESRRENQPHVTHSGAVITWDGRLDNREDLVRMLQDGVNISCTDVAIVAAAYEEWGTNCFAKLIGDWALSIWDPETRSLVLAKDPIGTRHLYYFLEKDQVTWSTILDSLVLFAGRTFPLCEEYIAGWFSFFPATHLTPYVGIHSVVPSSSVLIRHAKDVVKNRYWDFDPTKTIRYKNDADYEEHFRNVFAEALRRRLRSDNPILAELSGGMDSSSIVCMADTLVAQGVADIPRLDTVSYFNDSEPNWNERPYFTAVEKKRARTGRHIDVGKQQSFALQAEHGCFAATPFSGGRPNEPSREFAECMALQGNRVVLCGIGGDEVTGGVPTPIAELADLLARGRFGALAHELKVWALNKRQPWFHLFFEVGRGFLPSSLTGCSVHKRPAPWIDSSFANRNRAALLGYPTRMKLFGPLPSFQANVWTLDSLRRQLECTALPVPPYEKRYPYLDRGMLEFMYAIPREQVVRPGQRRSLMRRALIGIVPPEVLNRRRKAYVTRSPLAAISTEWASLNEMTRHMASSSLGIIEWKAFSEALQKARHGQEVPIVTLMRTIGIEYWLQNLRNHAIATDSVNASDRLMPTREPPVSAENK
jgi:asparagine synthase (glutamine-hydrolysing)